MVDGLPVHDEAFGWIDVRTGEVGPLDKNKQQLPRAGVANDEWPSIGAHARCPMYAMKMPPYATKMDAGFNLIKTSDSSKSDYCCPLLRYPDPQPVEQYKNFWTPAGGPDSVNNTNYAAWKMGDPTPQPESVGKSWFRVFRDGLSTFIITCGSGGSHGFKTWKDVDKEGLRDLYIDDENYFTACGILNYDYTIASSGQRPSLKPPTIIYSMKLAEMLTITKRGHQIQVMRRARLAAHKRGLKSGRHYAVDSAVARRANAQVNLRTSAM